MSSTAEGRKPARWYAVERALAPHVDKKWAEDFVIELRLLGVDGARIGDALSEVESHCAERDDSNSAEQAFGDPTQYARSLQLPIHTDTSSRAMLRAVSPTVLQVLGMWMLLWGFEASLSRQPLKITTAHLVTAVLFLLGIGALVRFTDRVLRIAAQHAVIFGMVLMANMAAVVISFRFLDDVIWRLPAGWSLGAGGAALIGGVWLFVRLRAHGVQDGPITSPLDTAGTSSDDGTAGWRRGLFDSLPSTMVTLMIPVATVILLAVTLGLDRMSGT